MPWASAWKMSSALAQPLYVLTTTCRHHGSSGQDAKGQEDPLGSEYVHTYAITLTKQTMW